MGAYLSSPVKTKESESGENECLRFGATTMQGWRMQQEDAHNCILDYDENCSLFAVYDGHGGQEVSKYASSQFPDFLKSSETWSNGRFGQALEESFLAFDQRLTNPDVVEQLKLISGKNDDDADDDEDKELLFEEATLPLEEVLSKYGIKVRFERDSDAACPPDRKRKMLPPIRLSTCGKPRRPKNEANKREKQNQGPKRVKSPNSPTSPSEDAPKKERKHDPSTADISMGACPDDKENLALSGCLKRDCNGKLKTRVDKNHHNKKSSHPHPIIMNLANEVVEKETTTTAENLIDEEQHADVLPKLKRCKKCCCLLNSGSEFGDESEFEGRKCTCHVSLEFNGHKNDVVNNDDQCPIVNQDNSASTNVVAPKDLTNFELANVNHSDGDFLKKDAAMDICEIAAAADVAAAAAENTAKNAKASDAVDMINRNSHETEVEMVVEGDRIGAENNNTNDADKDKQTSDGHNEPAEKKNLNLDIQDQKPELPVENPEDEAEDEEDDEEYEMESGNDDSSDDGEDDGSPEDEAADENESDNEEDETFDMPSEDTPGVSSGTTACIAIIKGNTLYVANAGDSRCVLCRGGRAVDLSEDHKPEDPKEKERIEKAGGKITDDGRVNGGLNLSRAIGDHFYKTNVDLPLKDQMISSLPDIRVETLTPEDSFMVLACDGIWNSMSSQSVVDFVSARLSRGIEPSKICDEICDGCLADSTVGDGTGCDNMTVIIIDFKKHSTAVQKPEESGTAASVKPETGENDQQHQQKINL